MADKIRLTPTYTSEAEAIYDIAKSSSLFKQKDYEYFKGTPEGASDYLYEIAGSTKLDMSNLDMSMYNGLEEPEDRLMYLTKELYLKNDEKFKSDYDKATKYLDAKIVEVNNKRFYNNLNDIQKVFYNTTGVLGNSLNSLADMLLVGLPKAAATIKYGVTSGFGLLENPISDIFERELTGEGYGMNPLGKLTNDFWQEDRAKALQDFSRKYTVIDRNEIVKGINDITQGVIQMAPLALNLVAPGLGTTAYYAGMSGLKSEEIFEASDNADGIKRLGQLGYLAASTGLEIATEKLSARIFGSNTMDKIFGFGGKTAGIGLGSNLVKSFISEGAEEGFTELVDAMLYKALVDGDADFASPESIFYAALIGGLTGGVMELGGFVFTPRSTILQSGRIVKTNDIKTGKEQILNNVKRLNLSKYASYQLKNALSQITTDEAGNIRADVGYSNVEKLIYNNETLTDVAVDKNSQEYKDAVEADKNAVLESTVALTKLMEVIGIENFAKSVGLLEKLAKDKESLVEHVVKSNMPNKNSEYQAIQLDYELRNPGEPIEIVAPKNKIESDLAKKVENSFGGIKVYFANTLPGTKGITYNGNYVIIKSGIIENERYDVTKKTVVEELIHTMQRDVLGNLSPKMMDQLDKLMKIKSGTYSNLDLDEAYAGVSKKVKRSEQQAKYLMELLLFDEITIQNVVSLNNGLFEKIYDKLKNIATYMFKGSEKGKAQFQLINRIMANYRKQIAKVALNKSDIDNVKIKASENEINHMKETVEENPVYKHFTWLNFEHTLEQVGMKRTEQDLRLELNTKYRDKKNKDINYSDITQYQIEQADGSYKDTPFVTKILNIKTVKNFETKNDKFRYNLNQYLLKNTKGNGSFIINPFTGQILQVTNYFDHLNSDIKLNMSRKEFFDKVKTVKDLFDDKFISKFPNELNVEIRMFDDKDGKQPNAFYSLDYNNPRNNYIGINRNYVNSYDKVDLEFITTIFHETTHHLSFIQKFHDGSSSELFRTAILEFSEKDESGIINKLLKQVSTEERYSELISKDNINQIAYELSDYMYLLTGGELNAALGSYNDEIMTLRKSLNMGVTENQAKMAGFGKISGFVIEGNMIKGYGKFNYVRIPLASKKIEKLSKVSESEYSKLSKEQQKKSVIPYNIYDARKRETFDISFSKTKEINDTMKDIAGDNAKQNLLDYGFSEDFVEEYLTNRNGLPENFFLDMIDRDNVTLKRDPNNKRQSIRANLIGTNDAVDKIIETYDNKNIKSLKDLREFIIAVPSYKILYLAKNKGYDIDFDVNKKYSKDEIDRLIKENSDKNEKFRKLVLGNEIEKYTKIMFDDRNSTLRSYVLTHDFGFDKKSFLEFDKAITDGLLPRQVKTTSDTLRVSGKEGEGEVSLIDKTMAEKQEVDESALTKLEESEKTTEEKAKEVLNNRIFAAKQVIKETRTKNQNKLKESKEYELMSDEEQKTSLEEAKIKDNKVIKEMYVKFTNSYEKIENKTKEDVTFYEAVIDEFPKELISETDDYMGTYEERQPDQKQISAYKTKLEKLDTLPEEARLLLEQDNKKLTLKQLKEKREKLSAISKILGTISDTRKVKPKQETVKVEEPKTVEEPKVEIKEEPKVEAKQEPTKAQEVTYKFTKAQDAVLNTTYENTTMSEVQKVGEANQMQQVVRVQEHLEKNKDYYEKLDDAEANAMFDAWNINNDSMNRRSNMLLFAMFIKKNPQRFNEDTMKRADDFLRKTLSMSGRELGLWSQIFERANPIEAALNSFKERFNKDLDGITKKDMEEYNQAFKEGDYNKMSEIELKVLNAAVAQAPKESVNFISKGTILERYEKFKRFVKKMNGFRYMAMLTNPATHLRNIASNVMMGIGEKIDNSLTKVFQNIIKFEKGQLKYISNQEIKPETIKYVKEKLEDSGLLAYMLAGGKYDIAEDGTLKSKINSKLLFDSAFMRKISDIIYNSLEGMDVKSVMPSVTRNLENLIDANGYDVNKMTSADFEMLFENALYRSKMTYLKNETQFSKWWRDTIRKNPMLEMTFGAFLPFPKVAYNITMQIMQHSPLGLAMAFKDIIKAKADPSIIAQNPFFRANIANLLAKGTQGTALMLLGLILSALKIINFDEDDQYNGMVLRLGNLKFRLSDLAPAISPMLIAAAMSSGAKNEKDWFERVTSVIEDQTIMGTFDKLFGYGKNIWNLPITALETYALQYIPSIVKSATKILDNNYKSQKNIFDKLAANLPLISYAIPNKVNPYTGEPLQRYSTPIIAFLNMFSPIAMSTVNKTSIQIEAERLDVTTTGTNGNFKINGEDYKLSGRELETFATNRAKYVEKLFSDFYNNKSKRKVLIENPDGKSTFEYLYYKDMSDDKRANAIESLYTKASELAKINYWTSNGHYFITTSYDELQELQKLKLDNLRYIPNYNKSKYIKK